MSVTVLNALGGLLAISMIGACYFLPAIIAIGRKHAMAIFVLNAFLGWTFVGWVAALVWACAEDKR